MPRISVSVAGFGSSLQLWSPLCAPDPSVTLLLCSLLQRLDLLVRDWQLSEAYGADAGQEYLRDITQDLEASAEQPLVLGALRARGTRCYLLPHPGT
nr:RING finger protein 112-like [Chrysemys picta bellii]